MPRNIMVALSETSAFQDTKNSSFLLAVNSTLSHHLYKRMTLELRLYGEPLTVYSYWIQHFT